VQSRQSITTVSALSSRKSASCPLWVKSGNSQREHMLSALPPKADIRAQSPQARFVP
jgi:hypothetical protein